MKGYSGVLAGGCSTRWLCVSQVCTSRQHQAGVPFTVATGAGMGVSRGRRPERVGEPLATQARRYFSQLRTVLMGKSAPNSWRACSMISAYPTTSW